MDEDDFVIFLVVGLMIIAVMLAVFNFGFEPSGKVIGKNARFTEVEFINLSTVFPVGPQRSTAVKTFSFAFDSSNVRETQAFGVGDYIIQNGVLFPQRDIEQRFFVSNPTNMDISFRVNKTNKLDALVIQVNGKTVASRIFEPGQYTVHVDNSLLSNSMLVTISAASSGWQIWAPDLYQLQNVSMSITGYANSPDSYTFNLDQNTVSALSFGKVDFSMLDNVGTLDVTLNQRDVFFASPPNTFSFEIIQPDLQAGENVLAFSALNNSRFRGNGVITIYYFIEQDAAFSTPINITSDEYELLNELVIRFDAIGVSHPGGLKLTLSNPSGTSYTNFATVTQDTRYEFVVSRNQVPKGFNVVTVSSIDSAVFDLADFDVKIR
jgi:hypothetical protein